MATITVNIVFSGTPYRTESGTIQTDGSSHMFFELSGQAAQPDGSWGFQPSGVIPGEGSLYYQRDVSVPFEITDAQAQKVRDFATQAEENGYGMWLPGINSCVDFVWDALREGGLLLPIHGIHSPLFSLVITLIGLKIRMTITLVGRGVISTPPSTISSTTSTSPPAPSLPRATP